MPWELAMASSIPFTFLVSLFREISKIRPRPANQKSNREESSVVQTLNNWVGALHRTFDPLPEGTTAAVFRLIFPEEDAKRRYDMQEIRLIETLAKCYSVDAERFTQWHNSEGPGCLGAQVRSVLDQSNSNGDDYIGPLSLVQVDGLLSELASLSSFSHLSVRQKAQNRRRRTRVDIIRDLYRNMSPEDASYLTQIILKDLRPLLYPLHDTHPTVALIKYNTKALTMLTKVDAMRAWDPSHVMLRACRVWSDLDHAAAIFDMPNHLRPELKPTIGIMVDIPKSRKGQSCQHSLGFLRSSGLVWAETKYDGERAQIHVTIPPDGGKPHITIFSKSKRDSTLDRHEVHDVICTALGFSDGSGTGRIQHNVILDAEMVAFDGERVDEFWRIRRLIETTAYGVRNNRASRSHNPVEEIHSQASMISDDSDTRHLGLVFFDILSLESQSLLRRPYSERRKLLEALIQPQSGRAIIADRFPIDMTVPEPDTILARIFADHIADHQEGLVLKAEESGYNDSYLPWVKFKKDYIPGCGDTIDMVLIGASWEKERARELRVGPNTFTTFYFGALKPDGKSKGKIHIEAIFSASYGLSREHLEELNFLIRSSDVLAYPLSKGEALQKYTLNLYPGLKLPSVVLCDPLLAELFGAGFSKPPQSLYYELRWPRITKVYRRSERDWKGGINLDELHKLACASVGRDKSDKDIDDYTRELFGKPTLPGAKCLAKRKAVAKEWEGRLLEMDGKKARRSGPSSFKRKSSNPSKSTSPPKRQKIAENSIGGERTCARESIPLAIVTNTMPPEPPRSQASSSFVLSQDDIEESQNLAATPISSQTLARERQLPTPTTSPIRAKGKQRTQGANGATVNTASNILAEAHIWVMRNGGTSSMKSCTSCSKLKNLIPRDRRVHSIDSLLVACGWTETGGASAWVQRGVVVVENHSPRSTKQLEELLEHLRDCLCALGRTRPRKCISVMTCDNQGTFYDFA